MGQIFILNFSRLQKIQDVNRKHDSRPTPKKKVVSAVCFFYM